jgi:hypothetical protein
MGRNPSMNKNTGFQGKVIGDSIRNKNSSAILGVWLNGTTRRTPAIRYSRIVSIL